MPGIFTKIMSFLGWWWNRSANTPSSSDHSETHAPAPSPRPTSATLPPSPFPQVEPGDANRRQAPIEDEVVPQTQSWREWLSLWSRNIVLTAPLVLVSISANYAFEFFLGNSPNPTELGLGDFSRIVIIAGIIGTFWHMLAQVRHGSGPWSLALNLAGLRPRLVSGMLGLHFGVQEPFGLGILFDQEPLNMLGQGDGQGGGFSFTSYSQGLFQLIVIIIASSLVRALGFKSFGFL